MTPLVIPPLDHVLACFRLFLPGSDSLSDRGGSEPDAVRPGSEAGATNGPSFQDMDGGHHLAGAAVCRKAGPCWRWGGEVQEVQARRTETYFMPVAQHGWLVGRHDASDQGRPSREPPASPPTRPELGQQRKDGALVTGSAGCLDLCIVSILPPVAPSGRAFCTPSPVCADEDRLPFSSFFVGPRGERESETVC
jgi:hypothetical protein